MTRTGLTRSGDISEGWWRSWKCYKLCNSKLPELVSFHKIVFGTGKSFLNILPNTFHPLIYLQKNVRKLEQQRCENHGHSSLGAYLLKKYDICVFLSQIEIRMWSRSQSSSRQKVKVKMRSVSIRFIFREEIDSNDC